MELIFNNFIKEPPPSFFYISAFTATTLECVNHADAHYLETEEIEEIHAAAVTNDQPKQTHFGGKSDGDAKDEAGGGGGGFGRADLQV